MARKSWRRHENAPGRFFVDRTCIDCDACRWMVPSVYDRVDGQSAVVRQPADGAETDAALHALFACPTSSIGVDGRPPGMGARARDFPLPIAGDVFHCGFHSEDSFGATPYLIRRADGNVLVDSPRFAAPLVERLRELGGVRWMFLTHRDDVADHARYAAEFGCERILHVDDRDGGTADVERPLVGTDPAILADDLLAIPVPGHTRGSCCLLHGDFLFTGDHLAFSPRLGHLYAFHSVCWYSWDEQIASMRRLREHRFEWVLPGHGRRHHAPAEEMATQLERCVAWMEEEWAEG